MQKCFRLLNIWQMFYKTWLEYNTMTTATTTTTTKTTTTATTVNIV